MKRAEEEDIDAVKTVKFEFKCGTYSPEGRAGRQFSGFVTCSLSGSQLAPPTSCSMVMILNLEE